MFFRFRVVSRTVYQLHRLKPLPLRKWKQRQLHRRMPPDSGACRLTFKSQRALRKKTQRKRRTLPSSLRDLGAVCDFFIQAKG
jgi:hypothetical protein